MEANSIGIETRTFVFDWPTSEHLLRPYSG